MNVIPMWRIALIVALLIHIKETPLWSGGMTHIQSKSSKPYTVKSLNFMGTKFRGLTTTMFVDT